MRQSPEALLSPNEGRCYLGSDKRLTERLFFSFCLRDILTAGLWAHHSRAAVWGKLDILSVHPTFRPVIWPSVTLLTVENKLYTCLLAQPSPVFHGVSYRVSWRTAKLLAACHQVSSPLVGGAAVNSDWEQMIWNLFPRFDGPNKRIPAHTLYTHY
jgi:hypothetical protein